MGKMLSMGILLLCLVIAGCSEPSAQEAQPILKLNAEKEPTSLDPGKALEFNSMDIVNSMFEGLMRLDKNHEPQPAAAKKVEISRDHTVYTFHLRDTHWSNGEPVTAVDFAYAWKRVLDPEFASPGSFLLFFIKNGEAYNQGKAEADDVGVKALDEKTLRVELEHPTPFFRELTAYSIYFPVYKKGTEENEKLYDQAKTYVSNGAFRLKTWKNDSEIEVEKNPQYRKAEQMKIGGIHWAMSGDATTAYQQYKSKDFHMLYDTSIPPELRAPLIEKGEVTLQKAAGVEFFRFNVDKKPFHNKKIRQAFSLAVDRQSLVAHVINGKEKPAFGFVAPGTKAADGDYREQTNDHLKDAQFERAKELLQEGMKEEGWSKLPAITLLYSSNEKNKAEAEALQEWYRKYLNVHITLQNQEAKVFFDNQRRKNYQFSRSSFLAGYNDPFNYLESFQTDHPMNRTNWSNGQYDRLLQQAKKEPNQQKRLQYFQQAEKLLMYELPMFPVYYYNTLVLQHPEVNGIVYHPIGPYDYTHVDIIK